MAVPFLFEARGYHIIIARTVLLVSRHLRSYDFTEICRTVAVC